MQLEKIGKQDVCCKPGTVKKRQRSRNLRPSSVASSLASSLARGDPCLQELKLKI